MKKNNERLKLIICILVYLIYIISFEGYYKILPSIPIHPNNERDLNKVKKEMAKRTEDDISFFYKTNESVVRAFLPYVDESESKLTEISLSQNHIIFFFKYLINRRRPYQIDESINPLSIKTSQTPSYPAGHAYQALVVCKYLSKKYPEKKQLFNNLAVKCDECRIKAGIHYRSDGEFSKKIFNIFN